MGPGTRDEMLGHLAEAVGAINVAHPTRVAIDGPPAAGKTTLADELAVVLRTQGRDVIRATIDEFVFPRAQRYPRGEYSAEGCYFDTHDYDALSRVLLDPLGPGGDRRFQPAVYDRTADTASSLPAIPSQVSNHDHRSRQSRHPSRGLPRHRPATITRRTHHRRRGELLR